MESYLFFCEVIYLFVNLFPNASFCYKKKASKMGGGIRATSKIPIPQLLVSWENFRRIAKACFEKNQLSIFIVNWEKMRSLARVTCKNRKVFL